MASGKIFSLRCVASHHAKVAFVSGPSLVLPLARVPLLKLSRKVPEFLFQSCAYHLSPFVAQISTPQTAAQHLQPFCRCI